MYVLAICGHSCGPDNALPFLIESSNLFIYLVYVVGVLPGRCVRDVERPNTGLMNTDHSEIFEAIP